MSIDLFGEDDTPETESGTGQEASIYTNKICAPIYEPKNQKPFVHEFVRDSKYLALLAAIERSSVSPIDKEFLRLAATRHIVFNYSLIADYYAHSSPEVQQLMEDSALVLIDFEDAIRNGYVKLSSEIEAHTQALRNKAEVPSA